MPSTYHTVILVPHARARLRKWRVSNLQIAIALGSIALLTLASVFVLISFFTGTVDSAQVERLRQENRDLLQANATFEESIVDLQGQLASYEDRTRQLAIVAGLDTMDGGEAGIGGDGGAGGAGLDFLEYRASRLSGKLDRVEAKLEERLRWISSVPSVAPVRGILTSGFGTRRDPITGGRAFHPAVDIAAAPGREVRAPADGIVTRAGRIGGLGNAIYLSHGFGITTRFGHMARLSVEPGERVERGDLLGYVGSSGRATGYHLHYEVHVDGEPINPLAYILDGSTGG